MKRKILFLMTLGLGFSSAPVHSAGAEDSERKMPQIEMKNRVRHSARKIRMGAETVDIEIHRSSVSINIAGKQAQALVVALFEPKSGLYWWTYERRYSDTPSFRLDPMPRVLNQYKWWATGDMIAGFRLLDSRVIVIESRQRQPSIDKVFSAIEATIASNLRDVNEYPVKSVEVPLLEHLGRDFFRGTKLVAQSRPSTLIDIDYKDAKWTLRIDGPDGEHGSVRMDNDYKVIEATRAGSGTNKSGVIKLNR